MNSEKDTLPNNEQILLVVNNLQLAVNNIQLAISNLQVEMNTRFEQVDSRFEQIDSRFEQIDRRHEEMRLQMMSFDVRIDRIEALTHEVLNVAYNARADVKVLREEVHSWAKNVHDLQLKVA